MQADALQDLKTTDNRLSVWRIEDDESNLRRIVAGLAANCECLANLDYVLVTQLRLEELNFFTEHTPGSLADPCANTEWHRDLAKVTAEKVMQLAKTIQHNARSRVPEKEILAWVAEGIMSGSIERGEVKLKAESMHKVEQRIASRGS